MIEESDVADDHIVSESYDGINSNEVVVDVDKYVNNKHIDNKHTEKQKNISKAKDIPKYTKSKESSCTVEKRGFKTTPSTEFLFASGNTYYFRYKGLLVTPNGHVSPISIESHRYTEYFPSIKTGLGRMVEYDFKLLVNYKLTLIYYYISEVGLHLLEKKGQMPARNRYSDLFDLRICGNLVIIDEDEILTADDLKGMWKYRIF